MASQHLSQDEFFGGLEKLFNHRKGSDHGAVYLIQKRLTHDQEGPAPTPDSPFPDLSPSQPMPIIFRASNGKSGKSKGDKVKLSTVVKPHELDAFYSRYAEVCKAGMTALKPRDRSKKKAKARKKKATS
ncbi:signal recognition particle protein domain-containing protein [Purpureocillium lavendulum]|uniref:Signal recognition particle subunit SRP14 n=1 Tax=Purpureocillium lavendulum TaxID=1247861 RepID=A0AB34FR98_9HYPO|nr:signal recognition particle protein domain-containing protein [Purpureocillium lavendulum]